MEKLVTNYAEVKNNYAGKKVFLTGHTGFKGSWLALWLQKMGAEVCAFSLEPYPMPNHFRLLEKSNALDFQSIFGDITNFDLLNTSIQNFQPDVIFHLAAQPLVRESYRDARTNYASNVMGTLNVLEAARNSKSLKAIVCITTDKVYENKEWIWGYRENDALGGYDPYSASKACCEILIQSHRRSFFNLEDYDKSHQILIATGRAGNVIGGGDWQKDRLIPDLVRSAASGEVLEIRSPNSVRPWQHVLEPLWGYLLLGHHLLNGKKAAAEAWNFSHTPEQTRTVAQVVNLMQKQWSKIDNVKMGSSEANTMKETTLLSLDPTKSNQLLNWRSVWNCEESIEKTALWYKFYYENNLLLSSEQIDAYITCLA